MSPLLKDHIGYNDCRKAVVDLSDTNPPLYKENLSAETNITSSLERPL